MKHLNLRLTAYLLVCFAALVNPSLLISGEIATSDGDTNPTFYELETVLRVYQNEYIADGRQLFWDGAVNGISIECNLDNLQHLSDLLLQTPFDLIEHNGAFYIKPRVKGYVVDSKSREPLVGADAYMKNSKDGVSTDENGFFSLDYPSLGEDTMVVAYMGYNSHQVLIQPFNVVKRNFSKHSVHMIPVVYELDPVIVMPTESIPPGPPTLTREDIDNSTVRNLTAIGNAHGIVLGLETGSVTGNPTIYTRGGLANRTFMQVEGIPLNNPFTGEIEGVLPQAALKEVAIHAGGFDVRYGNALSGVINVDSKAGSPTIYGSVETIRSAPGDPYGYNLLSGNMGGPLLRSGSPLKFFGAVEKLSTKDDFPRAGGLQIPSANISESVLPGNESERINFFGRIDAGFSRVQATLSGFGNFRDARDYFHQFSKNNVDHNPQIVQDVSGGSLRLHNIISPTFFWNLSAWKKQSYYQINDGFWGDDVAAYADSLRNAEAGVDIPADGVVVGFDSIGVFYDNGRVYEDFTKYDVDSYGLLLSVTKQFSNHLFEVGAAVDRSKVRYYSLNPMALARNTLDDGSKVPEEMLYHSAIRGFYGYDLFGNELDTKRLRTIDDPTSGSGDQIYETGPGVPTTLSAYFLDRLEFRQLLIDLGVRYDQFNPGFERLRDPEAVLASGENPHRLNEADFEPAPKERFISPRVSMTFVVSQNTQIHAHSGLFRRHPNLIDMYDSWVNIEDIQVESAEFNHGNLKSESATKTEIGLRHLVGSVVDLDINVFTEVITNSSIESWHATQVGDADRVYLSHSNATQPLSIKGLITTLTLKPSQFFSGTINYTMSAYNENALNQSNLVDGPVTTAGTDPAAKAINVADLPPRHHLHAQLDITTPENTSLAIGRLDILSNIRANLALNFQTGRSYNTSGSMYFFDPTDPYNDDRAPFWVDGDGYSNKMPAFFRVDMKVQKRFSHSAINIRPYLWIKNLLNRKNTIDVWSSSGNPADSRFLESPVGQSLLASQIYHGNSEAWVSDLAAYENYPEHYDIPRLIRLGIKVDF